MSVLCTLYDRCRQRVWTDPQMTGEWWKTITELAERAVPIDYQLPAPRSDTAPHEVRRVLAELSERYGDPNIALRRLEHGLGA